MMGGAITVESAYGEGATFAFNLRCPRAKEGASLARTGPWQGVQRFAGRVLVVEDNAVNQKVARATLKGFGLEVLLVENGKLAIDAVRRDKVDLILMDMHMPVMDGLAATRIIRAAEAAGELPGRRPIVAMTANVMQEAVGACSQAGMDDFLSKPFTRTQMAEMLTRWLADAQDGATKPANSAAFAPAAAESSVASGAHESAIAAGQFARLGDTMGDELSGLIEDFVDDTTHMFRSLEEPALRNDLPVIARHAHTLKSNAALIGAARLCELAKTLEATCKQGCTERLDQDIGQARAEFTHVCTELDALMSTHSEASHV
jgi:CheY-like chemotaxis protein/HPt (histidine-containing phosphotransfer) domain-containing protein